MWYNSCIPTTPNKFLCRHNMNPLGFAARNTSLHAVMGANHPSILVFCLGSAVWPTHGCQLLEVEWSDGNPKVSKVVIWNSDLQTSWQKCEFDLANSTGLITSACNDARFHCYPWPSTYPSRGDCSWWGPLVYFKSVLVQCWFPFQLPEPLVSLPDQGPCKNAERPRCSLAVGTAVFATAGFAWVNQFYLKG